MIELKHLSKTFETAGGRVDALKDVSLTIPDGDVYGIIGMSGAGKSTLVRCINMLERPTEGEVIVNGQRLDTMTPAQLRAARREITMIFQRFNLLMQRNCLDNVCFPMELSGLRGEKKWREQRALELLDIVGLKDKAKAYPAQLSGGQQQRVAIARALVTGPAIICMDEPLSNLDAKLRLEMRSELQRLHIDTGSTFIYVTHDQMEAMTLATKICLIENGVLQQYDAPLDVYAKPNNVFVADFVGNPAINFIDASGAQQSDGTLTLSALDGMQLSFRPKEPLDVAAWYERADAEDKARRDAENARALDKKSVEKGNKDVLFRYHVARVNETEDFGDEAALTDGDFVLGVRPEFLRLSDSGAIEGEIYSAMPTGMETTVKVRVGSFLLTGVVFGGVLYRIGQKIRLDFQGDGVVLFSRRNGRMIAQGSLSVK